MKITPFFIIKKINLLYSQRKHTQLGNWSNKTQAGNIRLIITLLNYMGMIEGGNWQQIGEQKNNNNNKKQKKGLLLKPFVNLSTSVFWAIIFFAN